MQKFFSLLPRSERIRQRGDVPGVTSWPSEDLRKMMRPTPKVKGPAQPTSYAKRATNRRVRQLRLAPPTTSRSQDRGRTQRGPDGRVLADYAFRDIKTQVAMIERTVQAANSIRMAEAAKAGKNPMSIPLIEAEAAVRSCVRRVQRFYGLGKRYGGVR